jgi:hypothetical protein
MGISVQLFIRTSLNFNAFKIDSWKERDGMFPNSYAVLIEIIVPDLMI